MKFEIKNTGNFPLLVNVTKGSVGVNDGTSEVQGIETTTLEVGQSMTINEGERLGRMAELTPIGSGSSFDTTYGG